MGRRDGEPVHVSGSDRTGGDEFSGRTLTIGQMGLADFLANGDHDALPADHCTETECDRDRHFDPGRNELRRCVERLLVGVERADFLFRQLVVLILHQEPQSFIGEVHVVAGVADHFGGNLGE